MHHGRFFVFSSDSFSVASRCLKCHDLPSQATLTALTASGRRAGSRVGSQGAETFPCSLTRADKLSRYISALEAFMFTQRQGLNSVSAS